MFDTNQVYSQALKYLNKKMYARGDLRDRLLRKGADLNAVNEVLDRLASEGLVNDVQYATIYLQNLLQYKVFGYYLVRQKLLQKKLNKVLVEKLLKGEFSEDLEMKIAKKLIEKKALAGRSRESIIYALRQKGFRTGTIISALKK